MIPPADEKKIKNPKSKEFVMCCRFAWLAHVISAVGAINWGLVYFLKFNLVGYIIGLSTLTILAPILYGAVALSGLLSIAALFCSKNCKV